MKDFKISIVIPCYNEEGNIEVLYSRLADILSQHADHELIFIDDGSSDSTLKQIETIAASDKTVKYISFSRNYGHQNALRAGLEHAKGDCVISLDADLQHPPEYIPKMIDFWKEGYEVVFTIRLDTARCGIFKKVSSSLFYRILNGLTDTRLEAGCADFRLLDRKVVNALLQYNERSLFLRGLIPMLGFKQIGFTYSPADRLHGSTKYSVRKMLSFSLDGITSLSTKPLHAATFSGFILSSLSVAYGIYAVLAFFITDTTVPGWASLLASVAFIGGLQIIILGILGEYIGKIFLEVKKRPLYIIKKTNTDSVQLTDDNNY